MNVQKATVIAMTLVVGVGAATVRFVIDSAPKMRLEMAILYGLAMALGYYLLVEWLLQGPVARAVDYLTINKHRIGGLLFGALGIAFTFVAVLAGLGGSVAGAVIMGLVAFCAMGCAYAGPWWS